MTYIMIYTIVAPIILLAVVALVIFSFIVVVKMIKRFLKDSKLYEEQLKLKGQEIEIIKNRLDKIEKILSDVE